MRTTSDNRVIVGGEDDAVLDPKRRDRQMEKKMSRPIEVRRVLHFNSTTTPSNG
jgi:hypothetical protein